MPNKQEESAQPRLAGAQVQMPPETGTFLAAQKVKKAEGTQLEF